MRSSSRPANGCIVNKGDKPLKICSIYAPAGIPHGTIHKTQQESMEAEHRALTGGKQNEKTCVFDKKARFLLMSNLSHKGRRSFAT